MKILLVYPKFPENTFWGFQHALKFVAKKAGFPPLGLLTVASMLPSDWQLKLVDLNIEGLRDKDIKWADYVFISAMIAQTQSAKEIISRCQKFGIKIVAGGPVFTTGHRYFPGVDHFVLGEAEAVLPQFLKDLKAGQLKPIYYSDEKLEITKTAVPTWNLAKVKKYASLSFQVSRGCPFTCEFCDVSGKHRYKTPEQIEQELDAIYATGFRGSIFVADDNFSGHRPRATKILHTLGWWQEKHKYPFTLSTEVSVDIADDKALMQLMAEAGFTMVFLGLETTNRESLEECGKKQNIKRDMAEVVKVLLNHGLLVYGGFIVGFDHDPPSIFDDLINFLRKTPVCVAMIGPLNALPNTPLYSRMEQEGRLLGQSSGNNSDGTTNFVPKMGLDALRRGYKMVVQKIYTPQEYYKRILNILRDYKPPGIKIKIRFGEFMAFLHSIWALGIFSSWKVRWFYWKALIVAFFKNRPAFPKVVLMLIYGEHFRRVAKNITKQ